MTCARQGTKQERNTNTNDGFKYKTAQAEIYRKFPKYSDTQNIFVITLKVEQDGVSLE